MNRRMFCKSIAAAAAIPSVMAVDAGEVAPDVASPMQYDVCHVVIIANLAGYLAPLPAAALPEYLKDPKVKPAAARMKKDIKNLSRWIASMHFGYAGLPLTLIASQATECDYGWGVRLRQIFRFPKREAPPRPVTAKRATLVIDGKKFIVGLTT